MPKSNAEMVQDHRARLRRQGLRPVQLWLPDTRTAEFAAQAAHAMAATRTLSADEEAVIEAVEQTAVQDFHNV